MPVIIPSGYGQFTLIYTGPMFVSGGGATVLGFGGEGEQETLLQQFAGELEVAWQTHLAPHIDSNLRLERIHWTGNTTSGDRGVALSGGRSGTAASPNTACLVSYTTGRKGRRGRGRSYWPAMLSQTDVAENGEIASARVTALQTAFDAFFNDLLPQPQVILQRDEPGQVTPPISPPPPVDARTVGIRAATQRRRLRR